MKRAALYARLSREDRTKSGTAAESTAVQLANARRFAEEQGWTVIDREFVDEGFSGAEIVNRPALQEMLAAAEQGQFDVVVLRDLDRLARDGAYQIVLLMQLKHADVDVWCYTDGTSADVEGLGLGITTMKAVVADAERKNTSRRVREATRAIVAQGGIPTRPPFGYRNVRDKSAGIYRCEPIPEQVEIILEIGRRFVAHCGVLRQTARSLNESGILSPTGKPWHPSRIKEILQRPLYRGVLEFGRRRNTYHRGTHRVVRVPDSEIVTAKHPELKIWPDDLLEKIDALLTRPGRRSFGAAEPRYLASGLVTCAVCGHGICARGRPSGSHAYHCALRTKSGDEACRGIGSRRVADVDAAIMAEIMPMIDGPLAERALEIVRKRVEAEMNGSAVEADRKRFKKRLADAERRLDRLTEAIALGEAPEALVAKLRKEQRERDEVYEALQRMEARKPAQLDAERVVKEARDRLRGFVAAADKGGVAVRPVLSALLDGERMRAVRVREDGEDRWHLSAEISSGWLLCNVVRHGGRWRPPPSRHPRDKRFQTPARRHET